MTTPPLIRRHPGLGRAVVPMQPIQQAARDEVLEALANGSLREVPQDCLCGQSTDVATRMADFDRYGLPLQTWICPCGIGYSSPRMDDASLGRFYDRAYRRLYSASKTPTAAGWALGRQRAIHVVRRIQQHANIPARARWADIGCGNGSAASYYAEQGHDVVGVDLDRDVMARGRDEGLDLRVGTAGDLIASGPFDVVTVNHVLEHVPDPGALLGELRQLLARDGVLYIEVPALDDLYRHYGDALRALQTAHLWHFTRRTLEPLAAPVGLQVHWANRRGKFMFKLGPGEQTPPRDGPRVVRHVRRMERLMPLRRLASRVLR